MRSRRTSHNLHPESAGPVHREVEHLVNELQLGNIHCPQNSLDNGKTLCASTKTTNCTTCATRTPITVSSNWGVSLVRQTVKTMGICLCTTTGIICTTSMKGDRPPYPRETGESLWSQGPWGGALQHTSTTLMNCNCGKSKVLQSEPQAPVVEHNRQVRQNFAT